MKEQEKGIEKVKNCSKCKEEKELKYFPKNKNNKDGLARQCKECYKKYDKANQENQREYRKHYRSTELSKQQEKGYAKKPKAILKKKAFIKKWNENNPNYYNDYVRERRKTDVEFRLTRNLRCRFYHAINNKTKSVIELLGCTVSEYKQHLEKQFLPEMNWGNHGEIWEIDHIKPCISFNLLEESEQLKCFHYLNTQPLFKTSEIAKIFGYKGYIGNRDKEKFI